MRIGRTLIPMWQVVTAIVVIIVIVAVAVNFGVVGPGAAGGTKGPPPKDTDTPVPADTDTPVPADTDTPVPADTDTPVPADTDTPVPADTDTPAPAATDTPVSTEVAAVTSTPTPTNTKAAPGQEETWDKSSLSVSGKCLADKRAEFTITNNGSAMAGPSEYRIYVNDILMQTGSVQLGAGASQIVTYGPAAGKIRLEADQRPGHPGGSLPQASVTCQAGGPTPTATKTPGGPTATNTQPGPTPTETPKGKQKITICHATGSATNPYVEITVSVRAADGNLIGQDGTDHTHHADDIIPAPPTGCPGPNEPTSTPEPKKISLCHATGSATNPYVEITVSENAVNFAGHGDHADDIIPMPAGGCPVPTPQPKTISLCHATGSATNPYVLLTINYNGLHGHEGHEGDIIPASANGCPVPPTATPTPELKKISLCHATGSATNPYVEISVSYSGATHGHEGHADDLIPMPAGGCPKPPTATPTPTNTPVTPTATSTPGPNTPTATPAPTNTPGPTATPTEPPTSTPPPPPPPIEVSTPVAPNPLTCPQWILFHSFRSGTLEIFRQDGVEGKNALITNISQGEGSRPSRSPNDQWVVFESARNGNVELYLADSEGRSLTRLTYTQANNINPMFGPDNRTVVFQSDRNGNWDIFTVDITTYVERQLTSDPHDDTSPYWSPDGQWIVFQSNRTGSNDVLIINVGTGQEFQVTRAIADEMAPSWSPNGKQLAFLSNVSGLFELFVVDVSGSNARQITVSGAAGNYAWSPEGNRIAYQDQRDGNLDVYTFSLLTDEEFRLTDFAGPDTAPSWDCGGSRVAFSTTRDGDINVLQVGWKGGTQSNLTVHLASDKWAEWSPSKEIASQGR